MGNYIYKVTAKIKTLSDGTKANIAVFAYKPCSAWSEEDRKRNARWAKNSGCPQAERFASQKSKSWMGRCVLGESGDVALEIDQGTFSDGWFDYQIQKLRNAAAVNA